MPPASMRASALRRIAPAPASAIARMPAASARPSASCWITFCSASACAGVVCASPHPAPRRPPPPPCFSAPAPPTAAPLAARRSPRQVGRARDSKGVARGGCGVGPHVEELVMLEQVDCTPPCRRQHVRECRELLAPRLGEELVGRGVHHRLILADAYDGR